MSLTSGYFLTGLALLAVGAVVGAVVLWRPLAGPTPWHWAGRAGLIVTVQLTGVALLAGVVNAQNDFFPTLGTLLGRAPAPGVLEAGTPSSGWVDVSAGNAALVAMRHPVRTPEGEVWRDPRSGSYRGGTTLDATLVGPISHLTAQGVKIWLPPQYAQPGYAHHPFPVLEILTGYPGNPQTWWTLARIPQLATTAIADGSMPPFVVVAIDPDIDPPRDTECTDVPGGPAVQTFLRSDLPIDLVHLVSVQAPGRGWALMGDSTGGYCATLLSLRYPRQFPTAVSLGGYFTPITDFTTGNLDGGSRAHRDLRDPMWLLAHRPPPSVALLLAGATGDRDTVPALAALAAEAKQPTTVDTLVVQGGGHNWATWDTQIPQALQWIGARWPSTRGSPRTVRAGGEPRASTPAGDPAGSVLTR